MGSNEPVGDSHRRMTATRSLRPLKSHVEVASLTFALHSEAKGGFELQRTRPCPRKRVSSSNETYVRI